MLCNEAGCCLISRPVGANATVSRARFAQTDDMKLFAPKSFTRTKPREKRGCAALLVASRVSAISLTHAGDGGVGIVRSALNLAADSRRARSTFRSARRSRSHPHVHSHWCTSPSLSRGAEHQMWLDQPFRVLSARQRPTITYNEHHARGHVIDRCNRPPCRRSRQQMRRCSTTKKPKHIYVTSVRH